MSINEINDGGMAFPRPTGNATIRKQGYQDELAFNKSQDGMTYRQWLAGMALQGIVSGCSREEIHRVEAEIAVKYADALIAELEKKS